MADNLRIGILGAKAYTARELVAIFLRHPHAEVTVLQAREKQPVPFEEFYGQFRDRGLPPITPVDLDHLGEKCDAVFLALPHKASQEYTPKLLEKKLRVLDLSADFRFRDVGLYERTYKIQHAASELCAEAVYGLPELYRSQLPGARLVACPGCYVTATILALAPLVKAGVVDPQSLIADAKSGVSGAGRTPSDTTHFCEANEAMKPYGVAAHRHAPEIEDHLSRLAGEPRQVTFVPHLAPMDRGIVSTCYASLNRAMSLDDVRKLYADFYFGEPFVRLLPAGQYPSTKNVAFSNDCDLGIQVDARSDRVIVMSAIDNLVKGASGQAVQCLNIVCGWEETAGLR
jgi:N-acetyl-gamma-glutamyl-phosphate reductase